MKETQHIAVLGDYRLMPERVGGMDLFFVHFNAKCVAAGISVDWFFPNAAWHAGYDALRITACPEGIEKEFLSHLRVTEKRYSHIVTHFLELCTPFFKNIRKLSDAKVIAVDHNPRPVGGYPLRKKIEKRLKGVLYGGAIDSLVGVSQYTTREIRKDFGSVVAGKCITIHNGIHLPDIPPKSGPPSNPPRFLVASHLRFSKGIQDLLHALHLLSPEIRISVDIYGEGPMETALKEQALRLGSNSTVEFKGSSPEMKKLYRLYDFMLQPTHMECFSLSVLESLAANVPVVTTPVGGNTEVISDGQNGLIFPVADSRALADLLTQLCEGRIQLEYDTRTMIERCFSLDQMIENHFNLIR